MVYGTKYLLLYLPYPLLPHLFNPLLPINPLFPIVITGKALVAFKKAAEKAKVRQTYTPPLTYITYNIYTTPNIYKIYTTPNIYSIYNIYTIATPHTPSVPSTPNI
jgi:hypothetical protein